MGLNLSPAYSQAQTGVSQSIAPSASRTAPSNRAILKPGSQGDSVSDLQALLKLLGFYTGVVDGVYQDSTASAVTAFQQAAGLQADGIVGAATWERLLPSSPILNGSTNGSTNSGAMNSGAMNSSAMNSATPAVSSSLGSTNAASTQTAIANGSTSAPTPSSGNSFPSPTVSPITQSSSPASNPPAAAQAPAFSTPQTATPQTATPQIATPQTPASTPSSPVAASVDLPILRLGMRGSAINALQERLKAIGAFKGVVDGVFGSETQEAVKTAQRNFNLEPDGIVGPATWTALLR